MTESYFELLLLAGLVLVASVLGVLALYSHTIMPGLKRTDNKTFVTAFQAIDGQIINPIFMLQFFAPVFLLGAAAFFAHNYGAAVTAYVYAALCCYIVAVVVTMAINVPLNDGIKARTNLQSAESFASARSQFNESKWTMFNHVRLVFTLLATIAMAAAAAGV